MRIEVGLCTVGRSSLAHTLRALSAQTRKPDLLILANQGPPDVRAIVSAEYEGECTFIQQNVRGLSRARNAVLEAFAGEWLMWVDDDEEPAPDWVRQLETVADSHPESAFIAGPMIPPLQIESGQYIEELYAAGDSLLDIENFLKPIGNVPGLVYDCWGGNMSFRSDLIEAVGGFDNELGAGAKEFSKAEDTDYVLRALTKGFKGLLTPRVNIYHTYGARPKPTDQEGEQIRCNATLIWKSRKDPSLIHPELSRRLEPYSRRRLLLATLTGGAVGGAHKTSHDLIQKVCDDLDQRFELKDGCLAPKGKA